MSKKPLVVNFFAGPGAGKSSCCASLFAALKWRNINCEMALEYAKDLVYDEDLEKLNNQLYVFGKQQHRMYRLSKKVDVIVTDAPLLNSIYYDAGDSPALREVILAEYRKYNNFNIFVKRAKPYDPKGRLQTEEEAKKIDIAIKDILHTCAAGDFLEIEGGPQAIEPIAAQVILKLLKDFE